MCYFSQSTLISSWVQKPSSDIRICTFKESIREDVKHTHTPYPPPCFGEASLKTPVLFCSSGGRCTWMWVSGSDVEIAKRLRKMKTRLGFIALVVDACHCILIQRSNKAIRRQ